MIIASILAIWVVTSVLFCVAIAAVAARRAPHHKDMPAHMSAPAHVEIEVLPDTRFEPMVGRGLAHA